MRQLATIRKIGNIIPIKDKDRIELAIVDGWSVIVKKGEFKTGDLCIYIEIDSVLPEKPEFEFLASKKYRIKTMKMAGVISQGICFPLDIIPIERGIKYPYKLGDDVTSILEIKQYEPTMDIEKIEKTVTKHNWLHKKMMRIKMYRDLYYKIMATQEKKYGFPSFISKTDEPRIQNMPHILQDKHTRYIVTEKIDGQSGTYCMVLNKFLWFKSYDYMVCSRNRRIYSPKEDVSSYWALSKKYNIPDKLKQIIGQGHKWVAIQGECISTNVQGNKYKVSEPDFYVFNLILPTGRMNSLDAEKVCKVLGLKFVPILETDYILPDTVEEMLEYSNGKSKIRDTIREGVVVRSKDGKQSFKAVNPYFLIKYDE